MKCDGCDRRFEKADGSGRPMVQNRDLVTLCPPCMTENVLEARRRLRRPKGSTAELRPMFAMFQARPRPIGGSVVRGGGR